MEETALILIVDDEPFNLDYLEQEIEDLGYRSVRARDGRQALEIVREKSPDMILLDIMMPVMDGFEVLSRLKASQEWSEIPVVVISAMSDLDSVVKGIELGAEDYLPKPFEPALLEARIRAGLDKKRLRDIEKDYLRALEREFEIGREIQAGFLPDEILQPEGWRITSYFQAARNVAGDFYDVFEFPDGQLGFMVGDVCDKGIGAALYMALFRSLLRVMFGVDDLGTASNEINTDNDASKLVRAIEVVNNYICRVHDSASFVTLFVGKLDPTNGALLYINAGHEPPLLLNDGIVKDELSPTGPVIGMMEDMTFCTKQIQVNPADMLLIYTDGITEVRNISGDWFERQGIERSLDGASESSVDLLENIVARVVEFRGDEPQHDDITLLSIKRK